MNARNDPRRAAYFCLNALGGYAVMISTSPSTGFHLELRMPAGRFAPDARIPYVSYARTS